MYQSFTEFIKNKKTLSIIQAENPDGDSLGSAIALDYLLDEKEVSLYCPIDIPKYLHYFEDWARVESEFDFRAEGYIIVDTAAEVLLSKLLEDRAIRNRLYTAPVFVIDHHETADDLAFPHDSLIEVRPATAELIYDIAKEQGLTINRPAANALIQAIYSDTLGLTSSSVTEHTYEVCRVLTKAGAVISELEEKRREFMKKSPRILNYKADLIHHIEYWLDGTLATVHIPWEEIEEYSDEYNPNVLILEELRLVEGVKVAVAIKTYPDGRVTGKIRAMEGAPIAEKIGGFFGGGGHPYAAGFRTYDTNYEEVVADLVGIIPGLLAEAKSEEVQGESNDNE